MLCDVWSFNGLFRPEMLMFYTARPILCKLLNCPFCSAFLMNCTFNPIYLWISLFPTFRATYSLLYQTPFRTLLFVSSPWFYYRWILIFLPVQQRHFFSLPGHDLCVYFIRTTEQKWIVKIRGRAHGDVFGMPLIISKGDFKESSLS